MSNTSQFLPQPDEFPVVRPFLYLPPPLSLTSSTGSLSFKVVCSIAAAADS
jgi:hypothetical protein